MDKRLALRLLVLLGVTGLVCLCLYFFWPVLLPFLFSYILVFALKPSVLLLERRGFSHRVSVFGVFFGFLAVVAVTLAVVAPLLYAELLGIRDNLPVYQEILLDRLSSFQSFLLTKLDSIPEFLRVDNTETDALIGEYFLGQDFFLTHVLSFMRALPEFLLALIPVAINILIIPFATFLLLFDETSLKKKLIRLVPNRYFEVTLNLIHSLNRQFGFLLRGMIITTVLISILVSVGLWIIGVPYPLIIGIFSGVANLIPYVGPIVGISAASLITLMTGMSAIHYALIVLVFLLVNLVENVFIQPVVMARASNLHPLAVIFLVLLGSRLGGLFGMLLAVPAASLLFVFLRIMFVELRRPARLPFSRYTMLDSS